MTDDRRKYTSEFEAFVRDQFEGGAKRMDALASDVAQHREGMRSLSEQMTENTRITRHTAARMDQIAKDTESWAAIDKAAREGGRAVAKGAEKMEKFRKIATPWVIFGAACAGLWAGVIHGDWSIFKEIWK